MERIDAHCPTHLIELGPEGWVLCNLIFVFGGETLEVLFEFLELGRHLMDIGEPAAAATATATATAKAKEACRRVCGRT